MFLGGYRSNNCCPVTYLIKLVKPLRSLGWILVSWKITSKMLYTVMMAKSKENSYEILGIRNIL